METGKELLLLQHHHQQQQHQQPADSGAVIMADLFQHVMCQMKTASPLWEDLLSKAGKLHQALRATSTVLAAFIDVMQKIADVATGSKGATREMGSALTRLCLRHRNLEVKLRSLSSGLVDALVNPLQEKLDEWKKSTTAIDKEHAKERKKMQLEIRQLTSDIQSLQNKVRKGKYEAQTQLDGALKEINDKKLCLEEIERKSVTAAMVEERSRFCTFVGCLKPIADTETSMLVELTSIQEVVESLCLQSADPHLLPVASQQVLDDIQRAHCKWFCQTPPGSRSESPRCSSHKSSLCSINSSSHSSLTSSPGNHSNRRADITGADRCATLQLPKTPGPGTSTISSNDSGFISQDTLFLHASAPNWLSSNSNVEMHPAELNEKAPTPMAASTWTNWPEPATPDGVRRNPTSQTQRPNTISSAYERSHARPTVTPHMFESLGVYRHCADSTQPTSPVSKTTQDVDARQVQDISNGAQQRVCMPLETDVDAIDDDDDSVSPLNRAIEVLNSSSAALDCFFTSSKPSPNNASDDLAEAMRKLELSTASLALSANEMNRDKECQSVTVVRRSSMQSPSPRSKPPPPIRRTSSVAGSASPMMSGRSGSIRIPASPTGESRGAAHRKTVGGDAATTTNDVDLNRQQQQQQAGTRSPPIAAKPTTRSGPRRTLSSTHADLIQSLNHQLAAGTGPPPLARRPYQRSSAVAEGSGRVLVLSGTAAAAAGGRPAGLRRSASESVPGGEMQSSSSSSWLAEIERGVALRPAVTDDRSAPRLRRP